jgi:ppGpp synthetase/RelA/SpoT-type nucleotidyltranferase
MMPVPQPFDTATYEPWHEKRFPADKPLQDKLNKLRESLKKDAKSDLAVLASALSYLSNYCGNEYTKTHGMNATFEVPLRDALAALSKSGVHSQYDLLFKSVSSIIDKLWRKNREKEDLNLKAVPKRINDLIRTEVLSPSLASAKFFSERLHDLFKFIHVPQLLELVQEHIKEVTFEPEMKLDSGYFAYHHLVRFKSGKVVEVQVYSKLMSEWRKLSHKVYASARVGTAPKPKHEYGTTETRLASLGHLLHLAECEMQLLNEEVQKKK